MLRRAPVAGAKPDLGQWRIAVEVPPDDPRPSAPPALPKGTRPDVAGAPESPAADEEAPSKGLLGTPITAEMLRVTGTKTLKRTPFVIFFFLIFNYIVLPQLGGFRQALDRLSAVNPLLLLAAVGLEVAALTAYAQLTRVTLPVEPRLTLPTVMRIQLSTRALTNLVPGGSAAGSTLGYRLLTQSGVDGASAGFTLATVGLGSAVVLNLLLWLALLISVPLDGFHPVYGTAAIAGMLVLGLFAGLVVFLMKGREPAIRVVRGVADKLPFLEPDTAERFMRTLVGRLQDLATKPHLIRRGVAWSASFWILDAAALWVFIRAFGPVLSPVNVIVAFCIANILAVLPITPGGLGVVEATLISLLVGFSLDRSTAAIAVVTYRLAQFWLPIPLGAISYASLRLGPRSLSAIRRSHPIRDLTGDTADVAGVRVWDVDPVSDPAEPR